MLTCSLAHCLSVCLLNNYCMPDPLPDPRDKNEVPNLSSRHLDWWEELSCTQLVTMQLKKCYISTKEEGSNASCGYQQPCKLNL